MPVSNIYGRVFEFVIVQKIVNLSSSKSISLTSVAKIAQEKDKEKLELVPEAILTQFSQYASIICDWLVKQHKIDKSDIIIDRLSDQQAIHGDLTDIRLTVNGKDLNLSIKHNNSALKHQRPGRMVIQCGYGAKSEEAILYKSKYKEILDKFFKIAVDEHPQASEFNQLKSADIEFISDNLYLPICTLVIETINELNDRSEIAKPLFKFLIGNTDYYKITAKNNNVTIEEFANITLPNKVSAKLLGKSYVVLDFSNGWEIKMRLHTASRLIKNDIKFDAQLSSIPVVTNVIYPINS